MKIEFMAFTFNDVVLIEHFYDMLAFLNDDGWSEKNLMDIIVYIIIFIKQRNKI